jgi:cell division protein FtsA
MTFPVLPRRLNGEHCQVSPTKSSIVCVLDVGSVKVACLIARLRPKEPDEVLAGRTHAIEVLGYGYQRSRGVKSGQIVDLEGAEHAIRHAVDSAERMAGLTIESLILTQTCGRLSSELFSAEVAVASEAVSAADIRRVLSAGAAHSVKGGRAALHTLPVGYRLDTQAGIRDPLGMIGERLGVDIHVVTSDRPAHENLALAVSRCHLDVDATVATPYASGLATLVDDESELGAIVIDIGGGTSTIAMFGEGQLLHVDAVAIGGHHVTLDIAQGLSIGLEDAERLKTLHGSTLVTEADERDALTIHPVGEDDAGAIQHVPRAMLNRIIRPRVDEILELVRDRLVASGFAGRIGRRVILTGGGSLLTGLPDVARHVFGRSVRLGRPLGVAGLPEAARGPAFAAVVGLLIYPQLATLSVSGGGRSRLGGGYLARVGRWLKESF